MRIDRFKKGMVKEEYFPSIVNEKNSVGSGIRKLLIPLESVISVEQ